jgi:hypothetical protein
MFELPQFTRLLRASSLRVCFGTDEQMLDEVGLHGRNGSGAVSRR